MAHTLIMTTAHPFEHFGPAPYRIVSVRECVHVIPGMYARAGSSCDYCGTSIRWVYTVRTSDGGQFQVGSDCAMKAGMTAAEIKAARREYRYARAGEAARESRKVRESAERARNPYGLTDAELREAEAQGRAAARRWLEAERKLCAVHVGAPGKRIRGLELRVDFVTSWDGHYGTTFFFIMRDRAGNAYTWKTSSCLGYEDSEGKWHRVTEHCAGEDRKSAWFVCDATVKAHGQYEGLRQTDLTRVKVRSAGALEPVTETRFLRAA